MNQWIFNVFGVLVDGHLPDGASENRRPQGHAQPKQDARARLLHIAQQIDAAYRAHRRDYALSPEISRAAQAFAPVLGQFEVLVSGSDVAGAAKELPHVQAAFARLQKLIAAVPAAVKEAARAKEAESDYAFDLAREFDTRITRARSLVATDEGLRAETAADAAFELFNRALLSTHYLEANKHAPAVRAALKHLEEVAATTSKGATEPAETLRARVQAAQASFAKRAGTRPRVETPLASRSFAALTVKMDAFNEAARRQEWFRAVKMIPEVEDKLDAWERDAQNPGGLTKDALVEAGRISAMSDAQLRAMSVREKYLAAAKLINAFENEMVGPIKDAHERLFAAMNLDPCDAENVKPVPPEKEDWSKANCLQTQLQYFRDYHLALPNNVTESTQAAQKTYLAQDKLFRAAIAKGRYAEAQKIASDVGTALYAFTSATEHLPPEHVAAEAEAARISKMTDADLEHKHPSEKIAMIRTLLGAGENAGPVRVALGRVYKAMQLEPRFKANEERRDDAVAAQLGRDPVVEHARDHWSRMSDKQKLHLMQHVVSVHSQHLGIPAPALVQEQKPPAPDGSSENAHFAADGPTGHTIAVNFDPTVRKTLTFEAALDMAIHENSHHYAQHLVDALKAGALKRGSPQYDEALMLAANHQAGGYIDLSTAEFQKYRRQPDEHLAYTEGPATAKKIIAALRRNKTAVNH